MIFGVPPPPKNDRKWLQKRVAAATGREERLGGLLGPMLERFWLHVGAQNRSQNGSINKLEFEAILGPHFGEQSLEPWNRRRQEGGARGEGI